MPSMHRLQVAARTELTSDSVALHLRVPQELHKAYRFKEGQFLTLQSQVSGEQMRRPYSICTSVQDYEESGVLRVGIRCIANGRFSTWAKSLLKAGDCLEVMTPEGRFTPPALPAAEDRQEAADAGAKQGQARRGRHHLAFAGGSGITPIMAILKTRLRAENDARFTLVYGNRHSQSVMFLEELEDLKNSYLDRFQLIHILSEERTEVALHQGLLDAAKCRQLLEGLIDPASVDVAYICGPEPMMLAAEEALRSASVDPRRILLERFSAAQPSAAEVRLGPTASARAAAEQGGASGAAPSPATSTVRITLDGKERAISVAREGNSILQSGLQAGLPLPYACQAGVCCTCRARVTQGEVRMERNFSLEASELEQGFVLSCQAYPLTATVSLSYDER